MNVFNKTLPRISKTKLVWHIQFFFARTRSLCKLGHFMMISLFDLPFLAGDKKQFASSQSRWSRLQPECIHIWMRAVQWKRLYGQMELRCPSRSVTDAVGQKRLNGANSSFLLRFVDDEFLAIRNGCLDS